MADRKSNVVQTGEDPNDPESFTVRPEPRPAPAKAERKKGKS